MKPTLAHRATTAALGLVTVSIGAVAYLLMQPAEPVRRAQPVALETSPVTTSRPAAKPVPPDFSRFRSLLELPRRESIAVALAPPPRERNTELPPLDGTAIGAVIRANGGKVPATGAELRRALDALGDFAQLPVPFSAVALDSGLTWPRVVMTQLPKSLADAPADRPNLVARLFLAANTVTDSETGKLRVNSVEFISWNTRRLQFDFGVIEGMGGTPHLKILDGSRCFSCHKNRGPILGVSPWSNTAHDSTVSAAMQKSLVFTDKDMDGLNLFSPRATDVDTAVRLAGGMLRDREIFRALTRTGVGREVFTRTLVSLTKSGKLSDAGMDASVAQTDLSMFGTDAAAIYQSAASTRLIDFDPSDPLAERPRSFGSWGGGQTDLVVKYDNERAEGKHGMTSAHVPSNPKAFTRPLAPTTFAGVAGVTVLARTIGLTNADRRFLTETLDEAAATAQRLSNRPVPPGTLAAQVFAGPSFADVLQGELPDRDDFKDRFVAGLGNALVKYGYRGEFKSSREFYTSSPRRGVAGAEVAEVVPTTACLRCHDVGVSGRASEFNPIPPLAFDPFDKTSREAWVRSTDSEKRQAVLGRMLKRMDTDRDMPPTDAAEYGLFREKDPAPFDAATAFLKTELRKANGR
jgi:hypothetical protein